MNTVKEPLHKSWLSRQVPETVKYETQNAGNIGNISKFCNEVVGCLMRMNADHGLIQRSLKLLIGLVLALTFSSLHHAKAEQWNLQSLMSELAKVKSVQSTFSEAKTMSLLNEPLKSSGTLSYKAPDFVEKRVLSPQTSYYTVSGDQVTIGTTQNQERQIVLYQYPALEAFIAALRATLAGDLSTLKEYYDVQFEGSRDKWTLYLSPQDEEMQNFVKQIVMHGSADKVYQVVTVEPNNDSSTMTITHGGE